MRRILVVDDERGIRELLAGFLQSRGYETMTAEDGVDALEKAPAFRPNLVLLDLTMPKMNGWKTLAGLRALDETRDVPVVLLTARSDSDALLRSEKERAIDYFIKPINLEELAAFLKRYIDLRP